VDRRPGLEKRSLVAEGVSWLDGESPRGPVRVQIRHRHASAFARVESLSDGRARIAFEEPVFAPAPGQAAVAYDAADERLLGGGWIAASA
jgi:tRNA-specific 2-thiouridylase